VRDAREDGCVDGIVGDHVDHGFVVVESGEALRKDEHIRGGVVERFVEDGDAETLDFEATCSGAEDGF
jgi:hypothetical protein